VNHKKGLSLKRLHSARRREGSKDPERAKVYAFPVAATPPGDDKTREQREVYLSHKRTVDLYNFDAAYLSRLRARHPETLAHFGTYFTRLLNIKLRAARVCGSSAEDIRQETLLRVLKSVQEDKVKEPEKFGPFVFSVCNNVMKEFRPKHPAWNIDSEEFDFPDLGAGPSEAVRADEIRKTVGWVLDQLFGRDRRILIAVFLDERDKDDVCREFNVNREYLRVLVHRALNNARKKLGDSPAS
jgi:RNA polymerase sigma-70 factor (ECF subfamily)